MAIEATTEYLNPFTLQPSINQKRSLDQLYNTQLHMGIGDIISQHTKRMRLEIRARFIQETKLLAAAIGGGAARKLEEKDDQIRRILKLNSALKEKLKSLLVENRLWREMARANEAEANSLRANLELLPPPAEEDIGSCCGGGGGGVEVRWCRMCGERESCVVVLPCRHLCLCSACGSGSQLRACPVCNGITKATLHVDMSVPCRR